MSIKYDTILLDIDNTLTELQPTLDIMAEVFGKDSVTVSDIKSFTLAEAYDVPQEVESLFWMENEARLSKESLLSKERVERLIEDYTHENTTIHIVTMRPEEMHDITEQWLKDNDIAYDALVCLGGLSKVDYALEHNIEAMFEDNPLFFDEVRERGYDDTFDLYVIDYEYNKEVKNAIRLCRETGTVVREGVISA